MVHAYVGGNLPRSETYMRSHWDHAKGFLDDDGLAAAAREEEEAWLGAQTEAGLTLCAPAQVRQEDHLRHLCSFFDGVEAGQLTRFFETNTFYRQPDVTGPIAVTGDPAARMKANLPVAAAGKGWVQTIPSPYDFLRRCNNAAGLDPADIVAQVGAGLNTVAKAALSLGAERIRIHDPSILYRPARQGTATGAASSSGQDASGGQDAPGGHDVALFHAGIAAVAKDVEDQCILHLWNGDPFADAAVLEGNPVRGLSIEDPGHAPPEGITLPAGTRFTAAVLSGQESLVEEPQALRWAAEDLAQSLGVPLWGISNGWDLEHVPHAIGRRKVAVLGEAARIEVEVPA